MSKIKVLICDDHLMFLEGLQLILHQYPQYEVCGEAGNGDELLLQVAEKQPAVVVTDIKMPGTDGIAATKKIKQEYPFIKVIALTTYGEEDIVMDMMNAGASGYVMKNTSKEELAEAINAAMAGGTYFCNNTSLKLSKMLATSQKIVLPLTEFSEKEKEIIRLICEQYASKQIADITNLSHRTIEKYRIRIMEKTGSSNVVGIVVYAMKNGLYDGGEPKG